MFTESYLTCAQFDSGWPFAAHNRVLVIQFGLLAFRKVVITVLLLFVNKGINVETQKNKTKLINEH